MTEQEDKSPYTSVTHGGAGFFAVLMKWYPEDNMWDVWNTGHGRYKNPENAHQEAKDWAEAEGIRYVNG